MILKPLKIVAWGAGGVVGFAAAIYLAAFVANVRGDRPPSDDALRLSAQYETRPALADDDNAFVYLLGFDAPLSDDPREVGKRRLAWLQTASDTPFDRADDPRTARLEYAGRDPAVARFLAACGNDTRECAEAFAESGAAFEAWNATHPWLLERYLALIAHAGWREAVLDAARPMPNYAPAIHGQRLLLLRTKVLADSGDAAAASELLSSDARFWRTVLASSDSLITKMIATTALQRHFAWGSVVIGGFPAGGIAAGIPREWQEPMTGAELSLRRTLTGEWVYFSNYLPTLNAEPANDEAFAARSADLLMRPFFQPQATLNRHAAYLAALADTLDAPLRGYARVADDAALRARRSADEALPPRWLYNWVGSVMMAAGPADYAPYARRVADLEGARRAALATVTLRGAATPPAEVAAALAASPLRNPYDDQPLRWDAEDRAIVFVGLEPGERGEHRFFY